MFKTKGEFIKALVNGQKFRIKDIEDCEVIYYDDYYVNPFRYGDYEFELSCWNRDLVEVVDPEWVSNIGDGVLCYVYNDEFEDDETIDIVIMYDTGLYHTEDDTRSYKFAKPLTFEQAKKYILELR